MTDEEWAFYEPFLWDVRASHGRKPSSYRRTLDGIFWVMRTGESWRNTPKRYGNWMAVYQQYRRWSMVGLWEKIESALRAERAACGVSTETNTDAFEAPVSIYTRPTGL
ncbi:transposase [Phaeobacter gallaeciensis]|uniref:transposase n=2 Tax=Alphaproteobacteria TaxID=28211 RepID=UPI003CD02E3A